MDEHHSHVDIWWKSASLAFCLHCYSVPYIGKWRERVKCSWEHLPAQCRHFLLKNICDIEYLLNSKRWHRICKYWFARSVPKDLCCFCVLLTTNPINLKIGFQETQVHQQRFVMMKGFLYRYTLLWYFTSYCFYIQLRCTYSSHWIKIFIIFTRDDLKTAYYFSN